MGERTFSPALMPLLTLLALAIAAGVWRYVSPGPQPGPARPERLGALEFPTYVPTPAVGPARVEPTPTPAAPPALLTVHVVPSDGTSPVPPTRLTWNKTGLAPIPAGGVLEATLPPGLYRFRIDADDHLCLEEKNLLLESGEVRAVTFSLRPAAALSVQILANVREGVPEGARAFRQAVKNDVNETLLHFQPGATFPADASGLIVLKNLLPGTRYELVASATGFLEQTQTITAGEITAVTFYLTPGGVIAGRVVDSRIGAAAAGVDLYLWGRSIRPMITSTTADGAFSFVGVWPGRYTIEAAETAGVLTSQGTPQPIELGLAERREDVLLVLGAGGTIVARVVAPPAAPYVPSPEIDSRLDVVEVWGGTNRRPTMPLDARGQATITGLPDGDYEVRLRAQGLPPLSRYATITDGTTVEVIFNVGSGDFIAGVVEDWNGNPVAGAQVSRHARNQESVGRWIDSAATLGGRRDAVTSATGYFRLSGLSPGFYNLVARAENAAPGTLMNVCTGRGDVVIRLLEGGRIEGVCLDAENAPRAGARVVVTHAPIMNEAGLLRQTLTTDEAGRFDLEHLPPGGYLVELRATAERRGRPEAVRIVDVVDGETTRVQFGGGVSLVGRIEVDGARTSQAGPERRRRTAAVIGLAQAWIPQADVLDGIMDPRASADEEGRYRLAGLPAGEKCWIAVVAPGLSVPHLVSLTMPAEGTATHNFTLKSGTLTGRLLDARGVPVEGREVKAVPLPPKSEARDIGQWSLDKLLAVVPDAWLSRARTDRDGGFTLSGLLPGEYRVGVPDRQRLVASAHATVLESGRGDYLELVMEEPGTLVGRVLGPPAMHENRDYALILQDEEGAAYPFPELRVDPRRGTFEVKDVPPGSYDAMVVAGLSGTISLPARAKRIVIRSGAESYAEFRLHAGYPVQVIAFDAETGQPVVGVSVEVRRPGGGRVEGSGGLSGLYNGWAGVLAEGQYVLRVAHPDYQRLDLPVEVGPESGSRFLSARMIRR
ncbi:carboxypeptidase regulatory-like domain-containing protein [bacterium]|nr:carboxypeptidase regulatory-like domain-containing protein [bacterium]